MELSLPCFLCNIPNRRSFIPNPPFRHSTAAATLSPNKNPTSLKRSGPSYFTSPWPRASTSSDETNTSISNHFEKVSDEAIDINFNFEKVSDEAIDTNFNFEKVSDEAIDTNFNFEKVSDEVIDTNFNFEKVSDEVIDTNFNFERAPDEAVNTDSQSGKVHDEAIGAEAQGQAEPDESINTGEAFASVSDDVIDTEEYSTTTPEATQTQAIELLDGLNLDYGDSFSIVINGSGVVVALWILSAIVGAIDSIPLFPKV